MNASHDETELTIPSKKDSEDALLGILCAGVREYLPGESTAVVFDRLQSDDFYFNGHAEIFAAARALHHRGVMVQLDTISAELRRHKLLDRVGGFGRLDELADCYATTAAFAWHLEQISAASRSRKLIKLFNQGLHDAQDVEQVDHVAAKAKEAIEALGAPVGTANAPPSVQSVGEVLAELLDHLEYRRRYPGYLDGVPSGLQDLDAKTLGFMPGDLVLVGARPGMGKSTFGISMAFLIANNYPELRSLFLTLEMKNAAMVQRMLSGASSVWLQKMRSGDINHWDWKAIKEAVERMQDLRIDFIDRSSGKFTPGMLVEEVEKLDKAGRKPNVVILDHLHILTAEDKTKDRLEQLSENTRELKQAARHLNIPIICLAQLSRAARDRRDKEPLLTDLRDCGEQDADTVIFIHRKEYYKAEEDPPPAELIIAKQRMGPTGTVQARYVEQTQTFRNVTEKPWMPIVPPRDKKTEVKVEKKGEPIWGKVKCRQLIADRGLMNDDDDARAAWVKASTWAATTPWAQECFDNLCTEYDAMKQEKDLEAFGF